MILKFQDRDVRTEFLALIGQERPDIVRHCHVGRTLPHLVIEKLEAEQVSWLKAHVPANAKLFGDVQFSAFPGR